MLVKPSPNEGRKRGKKKERIHTFLFMSNPEKVPKKN